MSGPNGQRCAVCFYSQLWVLQEDEVQDPYFCRRYPPTVDLKERFNDARIHITVSPTTWCGEWKAKDL